MTKYCTECGAELAEGARFCKKCGRQVMSTQPTVNQQAGQAAWNRTGEYAAPGYSPHAQTPDANQYPYQPPYQYPAPPISGLKPNWAGALCYPLLLSHPLLFLVGLGLLIIKPYNRDRFIKFHAYQSILLGMVLFVARIVLGILTVFTPDSMDHALYGGLRLVTLVSVIYAAYKAYHFEQIKLPVVGEWAEQQANKS